MNIQEQYFKGVPDYYPSMYLDGYTPQQIMYAVRNKMIREYKKRKMAKTEPEITELIFIRTMNFIPMKRKRVTENCLPQSLQNM